MRFLAVFGGPGCLYPVVDAVAPLRSYGPGPGESSAASAYTTAELAPKRSFLSVLGFAVAAYGRFSLSFFEEPPSLIWTLSPANWLLIIGF